MDISVVIPVLDEEESIQPLYKDLRDSLDILRKDYEIIFVDDGSKGNSFNILEKIHLQDPRAKIIQLRKNFGKSAALAAGFREARGKIIITMDGDLQDGPGQIHKFLSRIEEGYDLVSGWRRERHDPFLKRISSRLFNRTSALLTGIEIHDINCGFKAYRQEVVDEIKVYGELHRYTPILASWRGFKVSEVEIEHTSRRFGRSKYGFERYLRGFLDLLTVLFLTKYTKRPLHLFGTMGLISSLSGFLICLYLTILWFSGQYISQRPLLILEVLLLILGIQFISIGLLGEMLVSFSHRTEEEYSIKRRLS